MVEPAVRTAPTSRRKEVSQEQVVGIVVVALFAVFAVLLEGFFTSQNLLDLARSVSALGILAVGMGTVVIARGLDLSLVATAGVATAFSLQLMSGGTSTPVALAIGLVLAVAMGVLNGLLIAFIEIPPLFATLATGLFIYGFARIVLLDGLIAGLPGDADFVRFLGQGQLLGVPFPVILFGLVALLAHALLSYARVGRFIYAHGDNEEAAALTGISTRPMTVVEYVFAAVVGFIAGLVMAGAVGGFNTQVITGSLIYDVLLVVVLGGISLVGGRGGMLSVVVGTALIGIMLNGMTILDMTVHQQNIAKGMILLAALVLDNRLHPRDEETVRQGE